MGSALKFKQTNLPRQSGELARFKVVQGPDYGAVYILNANKATIGRGEESDIILLDLKASRLHAEMTATTGGWNIKDKGSANGLLYNGKATREANLKIGDTVVIGETTLEFITADAATLMLVAPPRSIEQVQIEQKNAEVRKLSLSSFELPGGVASTVQTKKGRTILIAAGVAIVGFLMFGTDSKPKKTSSNKKNLSSSQDLASFLPQSETPKDAEAIFKEGFREYLAGNYTRARIQFETVLQISPTHALATLYLENCNQAVGTEVKFHLEYGKKSFQAGKLRDARAHFERIMRLLYKDQSNPAYIEAKEQFEKVSKIILGEGEGK